MRTPLRWYVTAVTAPGLALLALALLRASSVGLPWRSTALWLFAGFVALGELRPIRVPRHDEEEEILTSTTFAFAVLLCWGVVPAVIVRSGASLAAAVVKRKPLHKALFNAAQLTLSLSASGAALAVLWPARGAGPGRFSVAGLPAMLVAAVVYFVLNNALTGVALALAQRTPVLPYLRQDLPLQASTAGVLLALSPIVVVSAAKSAWLIPLFALPMAAVYSGTSLSLAKHQALHDSLTDLPNRRLFRDRVHQAVVAARRSGATLAVMIIDLDRFKEVNDTLGHHIGDLLLQRVAHRLSATLREGDTIARLGGDEFAILLPEVAGPAGATKVAAKVVSVLLEPFTLASWTFDIQASIGIALYPDHGDDEDSLMKRADVAMYVAKEHRGGYELYSPERDRHSPRRLALLGELRRAIDDGQLLLHYQPKADMRGGGISGVEALVRWDHPQHGLIPPDEFISLAEHTGLIRPLTLHVLDQAVRQCREWNDAGLDVDVAVNLSVRNLYDPDFADAVRSVLERHQLPAHRLELEITESVIMADPHRAVRVLSNLSALGVGLSLDDFGVGYSSLAYIKRLPVVEIKIDKSFVLNIASDESDRLIVHSTIGLARSLGLRVVAEGVESAEIWIRLAELGCDVAQGFYLCRPMPADELTRWLRNLPDALQTAPAGGGRGAASDTRSRAALPA